MLGALDDPLTRLQDTAPADTAHPGGLSVTTRLASDSTLIISVPSFVSDSVVLELRAAVPTVRAARQVVFDLRGPAPPPGYYGWASSRFDASGLSALLPTRRIMAPALRRRMYAGFPSQTQQRAPYWSGTYEISGGVITPEPGNAERRVAFVVDAVTDVPGVAWALQHAGEGAVILDDAVGSVTGSGDWRVEALGEGLQARVRVAELVSGAHVPVAPDTGLRREPDDDAPLRVAMEMVQHWRARNGVVEVREANAPPPEEPYADMHYPPMPYRILAAYRWWNAIQYFYPYRALIGEDWDAVLAQSIPGLELASDSTEYALAVAEMVTRIHDSHGGIVGGAYDAYFGTVGAGVLPRYIEGKLVIARVADDSATRASGIAVGDVVLRVNGEDAAARRARMARYIPHSTPQALDNYMASFILRGTEGSALRLVVSGADDRIREVDLTFRRGLQYGRTGPIIRMLDGNIGYVDLSRLTSSMVDSMFETFRDTRAIIFDDRGYPGGPIWELAPRLSDQENVPAAAFRRPIVMLPDSNYSVAVTFTQRIGSTDKWRYHGQTVLLINESAGSNSEHVGLFFEVANHTTFIGSPTHGANGDVTSLVLPGGIVAYFTGQAVEHADGRQLQRVGLTPDILVRPTIAGVRAGRDEVLERALQFITNGGRDNP